jgi:hypothetical protein
MSLDINSLKCREAIRMKYEGEKYKDISHKLGVAVATLKGWFMQGGPLFDAYQEYSQEMSDFMQSDAAKKISQNVDVAAEMIVALMGSEKDEIKFKAAVHILDRCLGKPTQVVESFNNLNLNDLNYEHILKKARAKKTDK